MTEDWKKILKAINIGQRQEQARENTQQIVDKLIAETKYTQRIDKRLNKLVAKNQNAKEYKLKIPILAILTQKLKFRGQPESIKPMLQQKLAEEYDVDEVEIRGREIIFKRPKNSGGTETE
jgi:RNA-binding protein YhbY